MSPNSSRTTGAGPRACPLQCSLFSRPVDSLFPMLSVSASPPRPISKRLIAGYAARQPSARLTSCSAEQRRVAAPADELTQALKAFAEPGQCPSVQATRPGLADVERGSDGLQRLPVEVMPAHDFALLSVEPLELLQDAAQDFSASEGLFGIQPRVPRAFGSATVAARLGDEPQRRCHRHPR